MAFVWWVIQALWERNMENRQSPWLSEVGLCHHIRWTTEIPNICIRISVESQIIHRFHAVWCPFQCNLCVNCLLNEPLYLSHNHIVTAAEAFHQHLATNRTNLHFIGKVENFANDMEQVLTLIVYFVYWIVRCLMVQENERFCDYICWIAHEQMQCIFRRREGYQNTAQGDIPSNDWIWMVRILCFEAHEIVLNIWSMIQALTGFMEGWMGCLWGLGCLHGTISGMICLLVRRDMDWLVDCRWFGQIYQYYKEHGNTNEILPPAYYAGIVYLIIRCIFRDCTSFFIIFDLLQWIRKRTRKSYHTSFRILCVLAMKLKWNTVRSYQNWRDIPIFIMILNTLRAHFSLDENMRR